MSDLLQDIQVDLFLPQFKASNKKQVFQIIAKEISLRGMGSAEDILTLLTKQEEIASSAIGDSIVLAHLQLKNLTQPLKTLVTLKKPVAYETPDAKPVDVVCVVLSPEKEGPLHLRRLSRMARALKNPELRRRIRQAKDVIALNALLNETEGWMLAA